MQRQDMPLRRVSALTMVHLRSVDICFKYGWCRDY